MMHGLKWPIISARIVKGVCASAVHDRSRRYIVDELCCCARVRRIPILRHVCQSSIPRPSIAQVRVRFQIIRNARIENVFKSQSCMFSKLRIIFKRIVVRANNTARPMHHQATCDGPELRMDDWGRRRNNEEQI